MTVFGGGLVLSGCTVTPEPLTLDDHAGRVQQDVSSLFAEQEPVKGPISLEEAMARAIMYNLDHRLKVMESALANHQLTSANLSMLPSLTAEAGYTGRDNFAGSNSKSLITNTESLESSTSSDRDLKTFNLSLTWNVLDFGMSWVRAHQEADRFLITEERRRKVIHNIIQDVRTAYWNARSAERLLAKIAPLSARVTKALENARMAQSTGTEEPLAALRYRRELLDTLRQLRILQRELTTAKTRLSALMNLKPGTTYSLQPVETSMDIPDFDINVDDLENLALLYRPELREEAYQNRISHDDVKLAYLDMIPGVELSAAWNADSNSYLWEQTWYSWGSTITANLFDVFTGPQRVDLAKARTDVVETRRLALSLAVMSQVHVAVANYRQAGAEFETTDEMFEVEREIRDKVDADIQSGSGGEREAIRAELQSLLAELRRDLALARVQNAVGRICVSIGADPLPEKVESHDLTTIAAALKEKNRKWLNGEFDLPEPAAVSAVETPEEQAEPAPSDVVAGPEEQPEKKTPKDVLKWIVSLFDGTKSSAENDTRAATLSVENR